MNVVVMDGRLTKDPDISMSQSGKKVAKFSIANPVTKDKANFINCIAFDKTADMIERFATKGKNFFFQGEWSVATNKTEDGKFSVYHTFLVQRVTFGSNKGDDDASKSNQYSKTNDGFYDVPDDVDASFLPFN